MSIFLNGFRIELSASTFTVYRQEMPDNKNLQLLKEKHEQDWFLYWDRGMLYGIPKTSNPEIILGQEVKLQCSQHLNLLVARIQEQLPQILSDYQPIKLNPFTFLARKKELDLIYQIRKKNIFKNLPSIIEDFKITPKYAIKIRLIELRPEEVVIGLFLNIGTSWQINVSLSKLQQQNIELKGLYVVHRKPKPKERRLVGQIKLLRNGIVHLLDAYDDITQINEDEVWLEGSKASFTHCLKKLLGSQYKAFEEEREIQEGNLLIGTGQNEALKKIKTYLNNQSSLVITSDLKADIKERIQVNNTDQYTTFIETPPVEYCFDSARTKRHKNGWNGVIKYGVFSREIFSKKSPKIFVFCPDTIQGKIETFLKYFKDGINNSVYSGGFDKIFGLINSQIVVSKIPWHDNLHKSPALIYRKAIQQKLSDTDPKEMPDLAIVVILDSHSNVPDIDDPYLHSKAFLLTNQIPVQAIQYSKTQEKEYSLQYILRTFSLAIYAKLTGQPWTVDQDQTISDELVIGIGTSELSNSRFQKNQRFVGITTVFRGDGNYLLTNLSEECSYADYPDVLRESTLSILKKIKERNGWQKNDTVRLVFHATRPFKEVNIAKIVKECIEEVGQEQNVEFAFLTVSEDHPFLVFNSSQDGIKTKKGGKKGIYVPERGLIVQIGKYSRLLCSQSPLLIKKTTTPLPCPLLIRLHPLSNYRDLTYLSEQVLKFTALSWRSTFPAPKPVSIYYSELIANLLGRLRNIQGWSSSILNTKLRASKWFL